MPPLLELQRDFSRALLGGPDAAIAGVVAEDGLAPARRVQIYRNHVRITLREALAATFPVVARLVGDQYFAGAARRFIETSPPDAPVLSEYGAAFPSFLATAPGAPPYLGDVAALEWALNRAYVAPDAPALTGETLADVKPVSFAGLRFAPHPAAALVRSPFPVLAIWQANQPGADGTVDLDQGGATDGQDVLVWRDDDHDAACRALAPGDGAFVAALFAGATLGEAAAGAAHPGFDLAGALALLLRLPVFASVSTER